MIGRIIAVTGLALALAAPAFAQTATPGIDKRERNQQRRIDQGVKSGELTKGEAARLEKEQGKIRAEEAAMKADGKVTKEERKELHKDLNKASKDIARAKHNERKR